MPTEQDSIQINASLILAVAVLILVFFGIHQHLEPQFDFGIFYYAAHMFTDGDRHNLYSLTVQHLYQIRFHRPGTAFLNPPFALIPLIPLTILSVQVAFVVWTVVSIIALIVSLKIFEKETDLRYGNWPVLLGLLFVPVFDSLLHGQFSLFIVLFYALTYAQWKRGNFFLGGLVLSLALLKFQLVVGFVGILLLKRKWRELGGFATGALLLGLISLAMVGVKGIEVYPNFLRHSNSVVNDLPNVANWQGLLTLFRQGDSIWVVLLSIATLVWAAHAWSNLDRGFCAAVLAAMLASYHLTPQDISLAIVPFYLAISGGIIPRERVTLVAAVGIGTLIFIVFTGIPLPFFSLVLASALGWVGMHSSNLGPAPRQDEPVQAS
jgi:hypothetical protein